MVKNKITGTIKYSCILFVGFLVSSCNKIVDSVDNNWIAIDCNNLKTGIIEQDSEIVKSEINKLVSDLVPVITENDKIGHKKNINLLIERLNTQCNNISAELICYACIKTNPPQSEILVTTDSTGIEIKRVIDIMTPENAKLNCRGIHEYYSN